MSNMKYFKLLTLGNSRDEKYCFVDSEPEGILDEECALDEGGDLSGEYPEDPYEVEMELDEAHPKHIKIGSFISTTTEYVMIHQEVVDELSNYSIGEVDFWPFTLLNHKGKEHSKDFRFVVPRNAFDALHEDKSDIKRDANGVAVRIRKIVLDSEKLQNAPDMFRLNDLCELVFSEPLAKKLESDFTNFVFEELEIA